MYSENDPKIQAVMCDLAYLGIIALYGGCKGHGFWLARTTPENALKFFHDPLHNLGLTGEPLTNDGKKTGNTHFFTFEDAQQIAESAQM